MFTNLASNRHGGNIIVYSFVQIQTNEKLDEGKNLNQSQRYNIQQTTSPLKNCKKTRS